MLISIAAVIVVLGGLIFFHELGHFVIARSLGMGVSVFSLGFGPRLAGFKRGKTDYKVCVFPLGGYVQLVGQGPDEELPEDFTPEESFSSRPPWQRMLVVLAGPVFNFLLAWFIFWGLSFSQGVQEILPVIGQVTKDSAAEQGGLQPGDKILAVDGRIIAAWEDLVQRIETNKGAPMEISVERGQDLLFLHITPKLQEKKNLFGEIKTMPMLGIAPKGEWVTRDLNFFSAALHGARQIWEVSGLMLTGIVKLIERVIPWTDMGGVILITEMIHKEAQTGLINLLALAALISINLGILNLLPIPVLDGGHILFFFLEMITGKPLSQQVQQVALKIGITLLFMLMIVATANDILRHFR
ncbi:MAG: RIP metalloprotease RseP [Desulfomicrobium sp.]|jgi:regulator of sigma E protease|nr:RIP metalloprotease RseP [Desulfomicrobium sp.]NLV96786.1 RIP metalloprotease RseP [Desulfovibrionales bacterium]